jgi:hypothetical protein
LLPWWVKISPVHHQPTGAAFDVVLLLHVACVVVGLATTVTSAATAAHLRKVLATRAPFPETLVRYFRPGTNWAARTVYGIPVFGFALLAMSQGSYDLHQAWVTAGLGLFVLVVLVTEGVLWPAERRLQASLLPLQDGGTPAADTVTVDVRRMANGAMVAIVLLIAGTAIMLAQP